MQTDVVEITQVILWKLGLSDVPDVKRASAVLKEFLQRADNPVEIITRKIATDLLANALLLKISHGDTPRPGDELIANAERWLKDADYKLKQQIENRIRSGVAAYIRNMKSHRNQASSAPKHSSVTSRDSSTNPSDKKNVANSGSQSSVGKSAPQTANAVTAAPATSAMPDSHDSSLFAKTNGDDALSTSGMQWRSLPVPDNEPEYHTENAQSNLETSAGMKIVGSRVRGKKHKHEGTHCDDWYEFREAGPWTVLAVSDGGGSYRFSRLGARVSCEAAVKAIVEELKDHRVTDREKWDAASFQENDIERINIALISGMQAAWKAIQDAVEERKNTEEFSNLLGRQITTKDLNCTLLLAVHTKITYQESTRDLVFALSVGDGMVGAIDSAGKSLLLMTPDSGEHSGEVRFVDEKEVASDRLRNKIFPALCRLNALMVMSDGVADDYFPNKPGMSRLYGDLILNGVLELPVACGTGDEEVESLDTVSVEQIKAAVDLPNPDGTTKTVTVLSFEKLCKALATEPENLILNLPRFRKLIQKLRITSDTPEDALRTWLEHYHVRGSFDDRTLVVFTR